MADISETKPPPIPLYPPKEVIAQLPPQEWQSCLDLWIQSVEIRLRLSDAAFRDLTNDDAGLEFLKSYFSTPKPDSAISTPDLKPRKLRKLVFLLTKRLSLSRATSISPQRLFDLLGSASIEFEAVKDWKATLLVLHDGDHLRKPVESAKAFLGTLKSTDEKLRNLRQLTALIRCLPAVATEVMAGADYLETLMEIYSSLDTSIQQTVTEHTYYALTMLLTKKHSTMLTDNLWHLKSGADRTQKMANDKPTLLSSLLCTTSLLRHLEADSQIATKQAKILQSLKLYKESMSHHHIHRVRPRPSRKQPKGKGKSLAQEDMHMRKASQISQVHELFPDPSSSYIMRLLDHFSEDVEAVIAALLEPDSLPADLKDTHVETADPGFNPELVDLAPRTTPPPSALRKGVFDDDEFDRLRISSNQLHRGKKDVVLEDSITSAEHAKSKAAILSALAAFDSDDDERDDTYDVADVGGAVDNTLDTDTRSGRPADTAPNEHEEILFNAWKHSPQIFARDSNTRASNLRAQLKRESNMSDEQIEGWAIMLQRDPKQADHLQQKYSAVRAFGGNQRALESTRWQANSSADNSDIEGGSETQSDSRRMGQAGIRGHRNFDRGRGRGDGSTAGSSDDPKTQAARKRKEQGRGRGGANHRRDARAKKIGRGMGPVAQ